MTKRIKAKFDPRLKAAMREIETVLKRYDIGGQIAIVSPSHSEFSMHLPTWSLAQLEHDKKGVYIGIRFDTTDRTFATTKGKHAAIEASVHLIAQLRDLAALHFGIMDDLMSRLEDHFTIEYDSGDGPYPHDKAGEEASVDPRNRAFELKGHFNNGN